jgi:hypothetical protein
MSCAPFPPSQVPPRLDIKKILEAAYPYVKARGGIGQHGNFAEISGNRVAISPYVQYQNLNEFCLKMSVALDLQIQGKAIPYAGLVRESKANFHLTKQSGEDAK